ncbi:hypothetical protein AVEN_207622-1 [Araneus ventricosus]|uniref:Uncharacterized protein n=1 Tax=Araneus ventricosus TaxID=182803 RepID=A0A4Y2H8W2_ARAVE|nr:hypothetical protein AVEN_207622-1 [Araneus ventricosus]
MILMYKKEEKGNTRMSNLVILMVRFSFVALTYRFEATRGLFWTDLVILNRGQMTRTTPDLELPSPNFHATAAGGRLAFYVWFKVQQIRIHGGSSVESGFDPGVIFMLK